MYTNRIRINTLALGARLPTMHGFREFVEAGGLMSYGANFPDLFRRAADFVDKILRGAKPGDIPVEQPTKFDLVINLTTAKALGLDVPPIVPRPRRRGDRVNRREFITLLGGAAALAGSGAGAAAIGCSAHRTDRPDVAGFLQALQQLGWSEGHNLRIDYRWGRGNAADTRKYAQELVALAPDVLLVSGASSLTPLLQATRTLPIVFTSVADPVGAGFVESMSRPGGNATGFIQFEYSLSGKWLELLKQVAPGVTRVAVLRDPAQTAGVGQFAVIQSVASSVGIEVVPAGVHRGCSAAQPPTLIPPPIWGYAIRAREVSYYRNNEPA